MNIVCVCTGTKYSLDYVAKLRDAVRLHAPDNFHFWWLTDSQLDVYGASRITPPGKGVTGYWNKLALFKPGTFSRGERVLYFDLDILVRGPLDALFAADAPFIMARDGIYPHRCNSSLMAWTVTGATEEIWNAWIDAGKPLSRALQDSKGDQAWTERALMQAGTPPALWQDVCPGVVVPYYGPGPEPSVPAKWTHLEDPGNASVVIFHGKPRLHELATTIPWVREAWR